VLAPARPRRHPSAPGGPPHDHGGGGGGGGGGEGGGGGAAGGAAGASRLALGLFLIGVATLFLVLLAVWLLLRRGEQDWPPPGPFSPPRALWISTFLLLASSAALERAARGARAASVPAGRRAAWLWLGASSSLGWAFLGAQATLWRALWRSGLVPASSGYAAVFFALTGLHALHVLGGLAFQGFLLLELRRQPERRAALRPCATYWHFMGALWLLLFTLLYFVR
jgi:cytochrome c oxidase subunit 3